MSPTVDFLHEAEHAIRACLEKQRPKLLKAQGTIEHHLKSDETAVTEMDIQTELVLQTTLEKLDPSIAFGGEESGVDFSKKTFWLVDPIDGTEPFIRGLPFATNMISLIDNGEPVFSIIYNFLMGDFYVAIKGHGATVNGHPIHVSNRGMDRAWVVLTATNGRPGVAGLRDELSKKVLRVRSYGAAGFDYLSLANGGLEAVVQYQGKGKEWDFAPGALLVQEAGGRIANLGMDTYDYRNFNHVAANPVVFDQLMEYMTEVSKHA